MKKLMIAAAFAACVSGQAFAGTMENSFGNTMIVAAPDGATQRYFFNADNTFTATTASGESMSGTWRANGAQICLARPSGETCYDMPADKNVGDSWTLTTPSGETRTLSLAAGR
ncbi:MAG: hypothetical protein AB7O04_08905 [Hyphomonadaceae bacterium]